MYRIIQFNQKVQQCIDMNTKLRSEAKNDFQKDFLKLMNNSILGKIIENIRKHIYTGLVTKDNRRICLVSELNY